MLNSMHTNSFFEQDAKPLAFKSLLALSGSLLRVVHLIGPGSCKTLASHLSISMVGSLYMRRRSGARCHIIIMLRQACSTYY